MASQNVVMPITKNAISPLGEPKPLATLATSSRLLDAQKDRAPVTENRGSGPPECLGQTRGCDPAIISAQRGSGDKGQPQMVT